jgi:hypothetical protein
MTIIALVVLINVILTLCVINRYIPMDKRFKLILNLIIINTVVIWLLSMFGVFHTKL